MTAQPPQPPPIGEVHLVFYGTGLNDISVAVQMMDSKMSTHEAEELAIKKLQQRAERRQ